MTRKRFDSSPQFNVKEEGVLIQQVVGSSTNLLEVKAHNGATLMSVDYAGTMTSGASNTFTYLAATTSASLPANTTIGAVSPTELGYLDGVTSAIQTQIDTKAPTNSPTFTGTVTLPTGAVTSAMIADGTIVNADVNASAGIALSKLASGTSGQVVIANASGVPTYVSLSGDITVDATGATTIAANSVALGTDTTGNYISTITGTANQITVSGSGSESAAVTLSLPQNIHTGATPTFANITSSSRIYAGEWLQFNANAGCYWPNTGFELAPHIYPSQSTYSAIRVLGRRNGYAGVEFGDTTGPCTVMFDAAGNGGNYDYQDWHFYWHRGNRSISIGGSSQPLGSYYKCYINGRLYVSDFMYNVGRYYGAQSNSGATIQMSSGNATHFQWGSYYAFFVDGTHVKTFVIDHPTKQDNYLVHACAEGPTSDVFYRGEGQLQNGICVVTLPDYFEDLTEKHGRTVMITPIADENGPAANLSAYEIEDGKFVVEQIGGYHVPFQRFWWRVDAIRKNTSFDVEPSKMTHEVAGDGPYTYLRKRG